MDEKRIVCLSGGKDSTAMLLLMLETQESFDEILFADTGAEFPEIYTHLQKLQQKLAISITYLRPQKPYSYYLNEIPITKGPRKGKKGYGWPRPNCTWCRRLLKARPIREYITSKYPDANITFYIGIAYDERDRLHGLGSEYPLVNHKITEKEALKICYQYGFDFNGIYEKFNRTGCFFCPFQPLSALAAVHKHYPQFWQKLEQLDKQCWNTFKSGLTVRELTKRFEQEARQLKLF